MQLSLGTEGPEAAARAFCSPWSCSAVGPWGGQGRGLQGSDGQGWHPPRFRVRWGQIYRVPAPPMGPGSSLSAPPWGQRLAIWG